MSDNAAPILSRADTVNLISALRFHDSTDDERTAIHLKLTTTDAVLRLEIQRLTKSRDAISALFPDDAPHKHQETGVSLLDDVRDLIAERDAAENHRVALMTMLGVQGGSIYDASLVINGKLDEIQRLTKERDAGQAKLRLEWSKDAVISERNSELSALRAELDDAKKTWRCFGCGFETADEKLAASHFGDRDDPDECKPLCRWWANMSPEERGDALQEVILQLNAERDDSTALRAELAQVKAERDRQYEFNAGQIAKCAALEATAERDNGKTWVDEQAEQEGK